MHQEYVVDEAFRRGAELLARLSSETVKPPWESFADISPVLGSEVGHAFGTIIGRPGLDLRTREMATVVMLAVMGGTEPQVAFHIGGALRAGATAGEIVELLTQVSAYAGFPRALNAMAVARQVFAENGITSLVPPRAVVAAFVAAVARDDWAAAVELCAEDVTVRLPGDQATAPWAGSWTGRDGVNELRKVLAASRFEDLGVREPLPATDRVYLPGSVVVRHPDGAVAWSGDFVAEFRVGDGLVTDVRLYTAD
jgi:4-carboxymuconolactone decarboxylase